MGSIVTLQNLRPPSVGIYLYLLLNGLFDGVVMLFKINADVLAKVSGFKRVGWVSTKNIPHWSFFFPVGMFG